MKRRSFILVLVLLAAAIAASGASAKRVHSKSVRSHAQAVQQGSAASSHSSSYVARRGHRGLF